MELIKIEIDNLKVIAKKIAKFKRPFVATIGNFDGMHLYHQKVLAKAKEWSQYYDLPMVVISFSQNIYDYLNYEENRITSTKQKAEYIEKVYESELFIEVLTNDELVNTPKETFLNILKETFNIVRVVEGADFRFGAQGKGTVIDLQAVFGLENVWVEPRANEISSTKIRKLLKNGDKQAANDLLGIKVK
ncbi:FAD synthetase [Mesoplasma syrphidae]|uniref:FAD synthase n=1 Tax=Mesoplasma syrphidae TaxID=225999 RepID=A0A2K9BUX1_9MOLU|nr:hypothetical protein [Mesoplasma syrphidae]AUF83510.1 FAD synthetase [Mesoplasma syrphidae]